MSAITVKDVDPAAFIAAYARHLKRSGRVELPKWIDLAKTASWKELGPYDPDFYYIRAASIARKIYIRGGTGIGSLRHMYGGARKRGTRPQHHDRAAGSLIRHVLHNLEKIKVVEHDKKKGGRKITSIGQRDLDRIALQVHKKRNVAKAVASVAAASE